MPRTEKKKHVWKMPDFSAFSPEGTKRDCGILMKVEEYECVRLIDHCSLTQAECAGEMKVSRATVQTLYAQARKKLARLLVEGLPLQIEGGDYTLTEVGERPDGAGHRFGEKEKKSMKIAVTYENGEVFQHFGHSEQFKVYEVEEGKIVSSKVLDTRGQGHGALADFLREEKVDTLICGGIGGGARNALAEAGIRLFPGASGNADAQVESYLSGTLSYDPDTVCSHHGHDAGHECRGHGQDSCGGHCGS